MDESVELGNPVRNNRSAWWWPTRMVATGKAVAGFRGCWHSSMSWPVSAKGFSYQVCLGCGAKRLFDEESFRAFGPFQNELKESKLEEHDRQHVRAAKAP
jgi:hypothetical protein